MKSCLEKFVDFNALSLKILLKHSHYLEFFFQKITPIHKENHPHSRKSPPFTRKSLPFTRKITPIHKENYTRKLSVKPT